MLKNKIRCNMLSLLRKKSLCKWSYQINKQFQSYLHLYTFAIKKRKHSVEISTLMKQKTKVKSKLSLLTKVIIAVKADQVKNTFLFDINTQSNVISQCFTVISEMIKLNVKMLQFLLLNNHSSYCYDAYFVQYHLKDDWEQECDCKHVFYVMNKNELKLILSLFTLKKKNICVNCELIIWCFKVDSWMFILKDVKNNEKTMNKSVIYILLWSVFKVETVHI